MIYRWQCQECGSDNVLASPATDYLSVPAICKHCGIEQVVEGFTDGEMEE